MRHASIAVGFLFAAACGKPSSPPLPEAGAHLLGDFDAASLVPLAPPAPPPPPPTPKRTCKSKTPVVAYWAGWSMPGLPVEDVSFDGVTDLVTFSLLPTDGGVESETNGITPARTRSVIAAARARGVCLHVAIGGERTAGKFGDVPNLVDRIGAAVASRDLDGVVLDVEPLADVPSETMLALVRGLRAKVGTLALDVAPTKGDVAKLRPLLPYVDRIDLMAYLGPREARATATAIAALGFAGPIAMGVDAGGLTPKDLRCEGPRFFWEIGAFCKGQPRPCRVAEVGCAR